MTTSSSTFEDSKMEKSLNFSFDDSRYVTVYRDSDDAKAALNAELLERGEEFVAHNEFTCVEAVDAAGVHWYAVLIGNTDDGTHTDAAGVIAFLRDGGEDTFGEDYATYFDKNGDKVPAAFWDAIVRADAE